MSAPSLQLTSQLPRNFLRLIFIYWSRQVISMVTEKWKKCLEICFRTWKASFIFQNYLSNICYETKHRLRLILGLPDIAAILFPPSYFCCSKNRIFLPFKQVLIRTDWLLTLWDFLLFFCCHNLLVKQTLTVQLNFNHLFNIKN